MLTRAQTVRRGVLTTAKTSFALVVWAMLLCLEAGAMHQDEKETQTKLLLSSPVTHSDWMLHEGVDWGTSGVRHMLDMCKASGWSRVYWRALDGGRALYNSKLMDPQGKWDPDSYWNPASEPDRKLAESYNPGMMTESRRALLQKLERYDYASYDSFAEAVRYGHEIGLEVHAWITINEDDHGWGLQSRFAKSHPQMRWRKRDGTFYHSQMSFAYPEVREYKLKIIGELLDQYPVDGVFLDWVRTGDVRDNPQTDANGVADHGYEEPLVKGFQEKHGLEVSQVDNSNECWVRLRAEPHTQFMRSVRQLVNQKRPGLPISVLVAHPWCYRGQMDKIDGNLRGLLLDVAAWGRERLIDSAVAAGYYRQGATPRAAFEALREEAGSNVDVWLYAWVPEKAEPFLESVEMAKRLGAKQILLWEADYIDARANKRELQALMSSHAAGGR